MKTFLISIFLVQVVQGPAVFAQHAHHSGQTTEADSTSHQRGQHDAANAERLDKKSVNLLHHSNGNLPGISATRDGSGTSWLPDATPMHAYHTWRGEWDFMLHGAAFLRYTVQDVFESGSRGDRSFNAPNWIMLAAHRPFSRGHQLTLRTMLSFDPLTIGGAGYPLLFQTGELYRDQPLIDRQHPHDFFGEMAFAYAWALSNKASVFVYFGLPGEPALGPPAFLHRPSSQHNPDAPLSHHWQDAAHVVFGTTTLGVRYGIFKLDGSIFTGREPDENRFDLDRPRFDSYSARFSVNPTNGLALQISRGFLKRPEILEPETDKVRTTASVLASTPVGRAGVWSSAIIWGMNEARSDHGAGEHGHGKQHTLLLESDLAAGKQTYYGRAEWIQKSPGELGLSQEIDLERLDVSALTLGTARDIAAIGDLMITTGVQSTFYLVPVELRPYYGSRPVSAQLYIRLTPIGASRLHR